MDLNLVKGDLPPVGAALELVDIDLPNAKMVRAHKISPAAVDPRHSVASLLGPLEQETAGVEEETDSSWPRWEFRRHPLGEGL